MIPQKYAYGFPYPPYPQQKQLLDDLFNSFKNREIGVFEAPTGSGKSLALLCSSLHYLKDLRDPENVPDIELDEPEYIIKALKDSKIEERRLSLDRRELLLNKLRSTNNNEDFNLIEDLSEVSFPQIKFYSRTHKQIRQLKEELVKTTYTPLFTPLAARTHLCINEDIIRESKTRSINELCRSSKCPYKDPTPAAIQMIKKRLVDVEDAYEIGKKTSSCPYYASKKMATISDFVSAPYNFMENSENCEKDIIIVDEAHNLSSFLNGKTEYLSFDEISDFLSISEKFLNENISDSCRSFTKKAANLLSRLLSLQSLPKGEISSDAFIESTNLIGIDGDEIAKKIYLFRVFEKILDFCEEKKVETSLTFSVFSRIINFIPLICKVSESSIRLYREEESIVCLEMSRKHIIRNIWKAHSVALLGGTISPVDFLMQNIFTSSRTWKFHSYKHVSKPENHPVKILNTDFTFANKSNYSREIVKIFKFIGDFNTKAGIVFFVPSFSFLESTEKIFEKIAKISKIPIFCEKKTKKNVFEDFCKSVQEGPSILVAVNGGSLSEGINFNDNLCRILVLLGVPYPNSKSAIVQAMIKEMGQEWYTNSTMMTVNQSVGRAIRHRDDHAVIVLADNRYRDNKLKKLLSSWIIENVSECDL